MRVRVLLFAALREAVGQKQLELELPADATLAELMTRLEREHAVLARYRGRLLVTLNEERAPFETQLGDGDEVALLPPVSGGSERAWIDAQPLSMDALLAEVSGPTMGGVVTFTGVVRNHARGADDRSPGVRGVRADGRERAAQDRRRGRAALAAGAHRDRAPRRAARDRRAPR